MMEEIQLDYATLVSVYQSKVSELTNQTILLEAKNLILTKKLQELLDNNSVEVKSASRKKSVHTDQDAGNY
jgi:hypothetical protein